MNNKRIEQEKVLRRLLADDDSAFDALFTMFYPGLLRYAKSLIPYPSDEAEDIISDVFCHLWQNREKIVITSSVSSYLYRATKNLIINRHQKHRLKFISLDDSLPESPDPSYNQPHERLHYKEINQRIVALIHRLPERTRLVFLMSRDEGLTYDEIAELLEVSVNTIKTHMFRAIRFLKTAFDESSNFLCLSISLLCFY